MAVVYIPWEPISGLPSDWRDLQVPEVQFLAQSWFQRYQKIKESQKLKAFNERLSRQWAIETGILERVYTLDRGITQLLIEQGIDASLIPHGASSKPAGLVVTLIRDQKEVIDGLFDFVGQRRELTTSYIKQMHQVFTRHQATTEGLDEFGRHIEIDLIRGDYKRWPNNPRRRDGTIHSYCPPEQVAPQMERLLAMHQQHEKWGVSPEVEAAWLHHRFTQIHPFQDGNGRIARALATLIFLRQGWFPLVITDDIREEYITALEQADASNLLVLVALFAKRQMAAFRRALSISEDVSVTPQSVDFVIEQGVKRLRQVAPIHALEVSKQLETMAKERLENVAANLASRLQEIDPEYASFIVASEPEVNDYWFKAQIIKTAKEIGYFANTRAYKAWIQLKIKEERQANLIFSFHGLGYEFSGIMAVSAFIEFRSEVENNEIQTEGPHTISPDIFQFSHREDEEVVMAKFEGWLEEVILIGLEQWRRQI